MKQRHAKTPKFAAAWRTSARDTSRQPIPTAIALLLLAVFFALGTASVRGATLPAPAPLPLSQATPDQASADLIQACAAETRAFFSNLVAQGYLLSMLPPRDFPAELIAASTGSVPQDAQKLLAYFATSAGEGGRELAAKLAGIASGWREMDEFIACLGNRRRLQLDSGLLSAAASVASPGERAVETPAPARTPAGNCIHAVNEGGDILLSNTCTTRVNAIWCANDSTCAGGALWALLEPGEQRGFVVLSGGWVSSLLLNACWDDEEVRVVPGKGLPNGICVKRQP